MTRSILVAVKVLPSVVAEVTFCLADVIRSVARSGAPIPRA